ncbi:pyruvate synthase subunit PorC [bacterium BMS3Abin07]|nr:pyruvate synthase subunit PorC [bacterium BMS3Abin07]GBE32656.1 pyruvate synthase subunit PorC [bacterium BMS3Bbin05]HDO23325.1 pyruvate synthase [Nitrospirota bacterium]HDZ87569.1 pyruvate synthase [Nitrospirota bacterium]
MSETIEIRWHGRGGQGTVTAAKVLADACLSTGKNVQAFPEYGPERAGAPLRAYNRISSKELRLHCPVLKPNIVIIADPTLIETINVVEGAPDNAIIVVNTAKEPSETREKIGLKASQKIYTVDATKISLETIGRALPNASLLGALVKVSGIVPLDILLEDIKRSFGKKFSEKIITGNLDAAKRGYEEVREG